MVDAQKPRGRQEDADIVPIHRGDPSRFFKICTTDGRILGFAVIQRKPKVAKSESYK
jgi:hypothetical protein